MAPLGLQLDSRTCPLCGYDGSTKVLTEQQLDEAAVSRYTFSARKEPDSMRYKMVICSHCDLAYANPIPDMRWLSDNYVNAGFDAGEESKWAANNHSRLLDKVLSRLPDRDGALDIGTGDGAFLDVLLQRGFENVEGLEPSIEPIREASDEVKGLIVRDFFETRNYESSRFSIVTCFQVLEHIHDILPLARSVYRILKPGGCFLTICHDYRALTARLLKHRSPIFDIEHLQLFSKTSLEYLLETSGYQQSAIGRSVELFPLRYWLKLSPLSSLSKNRISKLVTKSGLNQLAIPLRAGNIWAFGVKTK